ncbi:MAG TPA: fatty acid desaturase [Chthoniobacterales bacterium]|nr:fatty acid desaturase [Chthoniobacterales bacterium]
MVNLATTTDPAPEVHDEHEVSSVTFQSLVFILALIEAGLCFSVWKGWYWLAVPLVLVAAHVMHGLLIGLHEASHGLLRKSRALNEVDGILIGIFALLPFSLYRVVHQAHHVHLATERDTELWPFVLPKTPRWSRLFAAFAELTVGLFYSPFLFLRVFLRSDSPIRAGRIRKRIWMELGLTVAVWSAILVAVTLGGLWKYLLWMYLAPAMIAANLQSWRKYIEHMGLTGNTVNSSTRSIVPRSWFGRIFASTLLHEPYHGVHHQNASIPHTVLPQFTSMLTPQGPGERGPFMSYRHALPELLRSLADPRVGAQWCDSPRNGQRTA